LYLPHSTLDLQLLVALDNAVWEVLFSVVGHIKRLTKESLPDEDKEMGDNDEGGDKEMQMMVDDEVIVNKEVVVNQERHEAGEKDVVGGEEQQEQEVAEVLQKGRKRGIP
jgi:hypothetical protein